jgi:hypothetical protein
MLKPPISDDWLRECSATCPKSSLRVDCRAERMRLRQRTTSATTTFVYRLSDHRLAFHFARYQDGRAGISDTVDYVENPSMRGSG